MSRHLLGAITSGAVLCIGLLSPLRANEASATSKTEQLSPFTHVAHILEGSDLSTIRFEKVRAVMIPTSVTYTRPTRYCEEASFRDPGGSAYCPSAKARSRVAAYEATYSFSGPPIIGDETGETRFSFQVYFRPEELAPEMRNALLARKQDRADIAPYFAVNTYRESVERVVVDEGHSSFCEGSFVDGNWTQNDKRCVQRIAYKTISTPSGYISIRIDPTSSRRQPAGTLSANSTPWSPGSVPSR